jgi:large subunit ribosomal protein L10
MQHSKAMFITEYSGMTMKDIDATRARAREIGGEFHIVKNTLYKVVFQDAGLSVEDELLQGSTAVAFAFKDAPAMAKLVSELARVSDFVKIKGGVLDHQLIDAEAVKMLGDLPPLPVLRSQLLGTCWRLRQVVRTRRTCLTGARTAYAGRVQSGCSLGSDSSHKTLFDI